MGNRSSEERPKRGRKNLFSKREWTSSGRFFINSLIILLISDSKFSVSNLLAWSAATFCFFAYKISFWSYLGLFLVVFSLAVHLINGDELLKLFVEIADEQLELFRLPIFANQLGLELEVWLQFCQVKNIAVAFPIILFE